MWGGFPGGGASPAQGSHGFLRLSPGARGAPSSFTRTLLARPAPTLVRNAVHCLLSSTARLTPAGRRKGPVAGRPSFPVPALLTVLGGRAAGQLSEAGRGLRRGLAPAWTAEGWGGAAGSGGPGPRPQVHEAVGTGPLYHAGHVAKDVEVLQRRNSTARPRKVWAPWGSGCRGGRRRALGRGRSRPGLCGCSLGRGS